MTAVAHSRRIGGVIGRRWERVRPRPKSPFTIVDRAKDQLRIDLVGTHPDLFLFFDAVFRHDKCKSLARELVVKPSTLTSRFRRAGLPSPKQYMTFARFVRAAAMLEDRSVSFAVVCEEIETSSSQHLHRCIKHSLGLSANEFRHRYDGAAMLTEFRERLILPYVDVLRRFSPLGGNE